MDHYFGDPGFEGSRHPLAFGRRADYTGDEMSTTQHPWLLEGYDAENLNVFDEGESHDEIPFRAGDTVTVSDEHELYAGEKGVVQAVGMAAGGLGPFALNGVCADVLIEGTSDPERIYVTQLEPEE